MVWFTLDYPGLARGVPSFLRTHEPDGPRKRGTLTGGTAPGKRWAGGMVSEKGILYLI